MHFLIILAYGLIVQVPFAYFFKNKMIQLTPFFVSLFCMIFINGYHFYLEDKYVRNFHGHWAELYGYLGILCWIGSILGLIVYLVFLRRFKYDETKTNNHKKQHKT